MIIVEEALKTILEDGEKPIRITKGYLLRYISDKIKIHNFNKLPLTKKRIEELVESLEQFRERKMKWAIQSLLDDGEELTMWKVIRRMGIGLNISDELRNMVANAIEEFIMVYP